MPVIKQISESVDSTKVSKNLTTQEIEKRLLKKGLVEPSEIREVLDISSVSITDIVERMSGVFHNTDNHKVVSEMGKTFLTMHGALKPPEESGTQIQLLIQSNDVKVAGILKPTR